MMEQEMDGLAILRQLNTAVALAPKTATEEPPDCVLKEYRCKVHNCSKPAIWRCSGGFHYCDYHMKQPHDWDADHLFVLLTSDEAEPKITFNR